jgi:hypothetical protein
VQLRADRVPALERRRRRSRIAHADLPGGQLLAVRSRQAQPAVTVDGARRAAPVRQHQRGVPLTRARAAGYEPRGQVSGLAAIRPPGGAAAVPRRGRRGGRGRATGRVTGGCRACGRRCRLGHRCPMGRRSVRGPCDRPLEGTAAHAHHGQEDRRGPNRRSRHTRTLDIPAGLPGPYEFPVPTSRCRFGNPTRCRRPRRPERPPGPTARPRRSTVGPGRDPPRRPRRGEAVSGCASRRSRHRWRR